jgi:hypothetical protein
LTAALARPYDSRVPRRLTTNRASPRTEWTRTAVVDLAAARGDRRLRDARERLRSMSDGNRRALSRLFQTGLIFTRTGARLGRELLLAHQHLTRVADLVARLGDPAGRPRRDAEAEALYGQVQLLLARTAELSARSEGLLARER